MKHLRNDTLRLAATYLTIIMVMSVGFSTIFYNVSLRELNHRPDGLGTLNQVIVTPTPNMTITDYLEQREDESRIALLADLVAVNLLTLVIGALLSYLLAEKTLKPIEENMEAQARFVSDASHELRTPLTALRTANEVALRQKQLSAKDARQVIAENIDDITRLQELTNSMLGLMREDPTKDTWQSVSLKKIMAETVKLTAAQAQSKGVVVKLGETALRVKVNEQQMVQLLTILTDNAIKYSKPNGVVQLRATRQGKNVVVSVKDKGVGMSAEDMSRIFTRFYRAEQSRTTSGYGLGLAIAKKISDAHHAKLAVKSQLGKGSEFTFTLPVSGDTHE